MTVINMAMIENIQNGIRDIVYGEYNIVPDTIKITNRDLDKLKREMLATSYVFETETIMGLKIVVDNNLNDDECVIYNSKCCIEIKNLGDANVATDEGERK